MKYKISFCTTCMNRLHHLERTLPKNLFDNQDYDNIEFVVLNYNSKDDIDTWMKHNMMNHIKAHKLIYIKTLEPVFFKGAHAKNIVTKFSTGDIVCNIDADNFTGKGFASYVNREFNKNSNIFVSGRRDAVGDLMGRLCTWRADFLNLRGYDESIVDYGWEDDDFHSRLKRLGRVEKLIGDRNYLKFIKHEQCERMINGKYFNEIEYALVYESVNEAMAYIFRVDGKFEYLKVRINEKSTLKPLESHTLTEQVIFEEWSMHGNNIVLKNPWSDYPIVLTTHDAGNTYECKGNPYKRISKIESSYRYADLMGEAAYKRNAESGVEINPIGFGLGSCFEVYDSSNFKRSK